MPPKKAVSTTGTIEPEGVPYSINLNSKIVVVGTGVVSNTERDTFRQKAEPSLEEQIRARPGFAAIAAAAAMVGSSSIAPLAEASSSGAAGDGASSHTTVTAKPAALLQREMQALGITSQSARSADVLPQPEVRRPPALAAPLVCKRCSRTDGHKDGIAVHKCAQCGVSLCSVQCTARLLACPHFPWTYTSARRGVGPSVGHFNNIALEFHYRNYAHRCAGLGCACACCCFATCPDWVEFESQNLHDEDAWYRRSLIDALAAVGNPMCRLRHVVERCQACSGSCGLETELGELCGDADLRAVVHELITSVENLASDPVSMEV